MTKDLRDRQRTDERRIGRQGTGKLDQEAPPTPEPIHHESAEEAAAGTPALDAAAVEALRQRLHAEREAAIGELRTLGISPDIDDTTPRRGTDIVLDEGDAAQASERQDMNFMTRQRLAERINRLTAALERMQQGAYGVCAVCGRPIEPARLAAVPESDMCLQCRKEREAAAEAA